MDIFKDHLTRATDVEVINSKTLAISQEDQGVGSLIRTTFTDAVNSIRND